MPAGPASRVVRIEDRYITGTRLRLRRRTDDTADVLPVLKLAEGTGRGRRPGLTTNLYLSAAEYEALASLPAATIGKTCHGLGDLVVDVFDGPLAGLLLAEAEFYAEADCTSFQPPPSVVAEVTGDARFRGGQTRRLYAGRRRGRRPRGLRRRAESLTPGG